MKKIELRQLAYCRSGDKGDISDIGVMAFNREYYDILKKQLTPDRVKKHFKGMVKGGVEIYEMANINAFEIVLHNALDGGAPATLRFGQTGKSMGCALSFMELEVPDKLKLGEGWAENQP